MKHLPRQNFFTPATRWLCALLAAMFLPAGASAQPKDPQRWLLVFDLSSTMKNRLPATEEILKDFFATSGGGRLQEGDYIGVWTCDQKLHTGQFPLITWDPKQATSVRTNLVGFLRSRHFAGASRLAALQPALGGVIADSERLTIILFCAGESEWGSTPYDSGIHQNFLDGREERRKNKQPFVVLIRTLSGKFIGCTVNFPPGAINIPLFLAPPPPTNAPPLTHVAVPVQPPPVVPVPALVIVGTNVGPAATTLPKPPPPAVKPVPVVTIKVVVIATNPTPAALPPPTTNLVATNIIQPAVMAATNGPPPKAVAPVSNVVAKVEIPAPGNRVAAIVTPLVTNAMAPPARVEAPMAGPAINPTSASTNDNADRRTWLMVFAGLGLLAAAIVLVVALMVRAGRRPRSSLITRSMRTTRRK